MRASRGMGDINPSKMPKAKTIVRKDNPNDVTMYAEGGTVNAAGNYTKPSFTKVCGKQSIDENSSRI
jgi:hypothetical protein